MAVQEQRHQGPRRRLRFGGSIASGSATSATAVSASLGWLALPACAEA